VCVCDGEGGGEEGYVNYLLGNTEWIDSSSSNANYVDIFKIKNEGQNYFKMYIDYTVPPLKSEEEPRYSKVSMLITSIMGDTTVLEFWKNMTIKLLWIKAIGNGAIKLRSNGAMNH
jgi:hypothetical protein